MSQNAVLQALPKLDRPYSGFLEYHRIFIDENRLSIQKVFRYCLETKSLSAYTYMNMLPAPKYIFVNATNEKYKILIKIQHQTAKKIVKLNKKIQHLFLIRRTRKLI